MKTIIMIIVFSVAFSLSLHAKDIEVSTILKIENGTKEISFDRGLTWNQFIRTANILLRKGENEFYSFDRGLTWHKSGVTDNLINTNNTFVFPNPLIIPIDQFEIIGVDDGNYELLISDISGNLLFTNSVKIDNSNLKLKVLEEMNRNQMYILKLYNSNKEYSFKILTE